MELESYTLDVNGQEVQVQALPDMPLLWVLRDLLQLNGTKFGCGMGLCGACTVHLDGMAMRSCVFPVSAASSKKITTIEGVSGAGIALQKAWIEQDVPQCGYCQPGQIMSATALLSSNDNPDDEAIDAAMSGNICRCGTYPKIRRAIKTVAANNLAYPAEGGEKP